MTFLKTIVTDTINNMSSLIYELKDKNDNIDVNLVSELVPYPKTALQQSKVDDLNCQARKWGEAGK